MATDGERPDLRVSDADREAVVALLRRHVADGRLDLDDFTARLDQVYDAKTNADLESTLGDLPAIREEPPPGELGEAALRARRGFRNHLARYLIVNLFLIGIWLVTGGGHFWPAYPILGWGMGLAIHAWNAYGEGADDDAGEDDG